MQARCSSGVCKGALRLLSLFGDMTLVNRCAAIIAALLPMGGWAAGSAMTLTSPAFAHNAAIPRAYTCQGADTSVPLAWSGVPPGAKSLVLIVDDPDAPDPKSPQVIWVHWLLYNIPPSSFGLKQGVSAKDLLPGTRTGLNDWKRAGYGGPCPPVGRHRYFHKLYALDTLLQTRAGADKAAVEKAMAGHVLAQAELIGTYQQD
jgi:Raf kinase inhibitor-like YbhB/YbcL family protein